MGVFKEGLPDDTETEKVPKGNEDIEGALEPEEQGAVALAAAQSTARKLSSGLLEVQDFLPLGAVGSKVDDNDDDDNEGDVLKKESPKAGSRQDLRVSSGEGGDDMTANKSSSALEIYAKAREINVLLKRLASQGTPRVVEDTQDESKEYETGDGVRQTEENVRESPQSPNESVNGDSVVVGDHLSDRKEENYETGTGKPDSCVDDDACGTKDVAKFPEEVKNIQRESHFHVDGWTERGSIQVTPPDGVYRAIRRLFCESSVSDGDDSEEEGYAALKCESIQTIKKMQREEEEEEEEEIKDGWLEESKYPRLTRRETTGEKEKEMSKDTRNTFPPTTTHESRLVSDTSRDDDGDLESCSSEDSYSSSSAEDSEDLSQSLSESETADSEDYSGTSSSDDASGSEDGGSSRTRNFSGSSSEVTEEVDSDIEVVHVMRKGRGSKVRDEGEVQTVDLEEEEKEGEEEEEGDEKTGDDEVVIIKVVERVKRILETTQEELEVICTKLRSNGAADVGRDHLDKRERGGEEESHTSEVSFELSPMPRRLRHGPKDDHERDGEPKRGQGVLNIRYVLGEEDNPDIVKMEILPDAGWRRTLNNTKKEGGNTLVDMNEEFRETVHNKRKFEEEGEVIDEKEQETIRLMQQGMKRTSDGNIKVLEAVKSVDPNNGPSPPKKRRSLDIEAVESADNIDVETTDEKEEEEGKEKILFVEQGARRTSDENIKVPETVKTVDPNNGHSSPKKRKSEDLETVKSTRLTDFNTEFSPPERGLRSEIDAVDSVKNTDLSQPTGRTIPETKTEEDFTTKDSGTGPSPPKSGSNLALGPEAPVTSGIALGEDQPKYHARRDRHRPCRGIRLYNRIRNLNANIKKPQKCKSVQAKSLHWQCQCIVTRRTRFVTKCDYCRLCTPSKGRKQQLPFVHKGCGELLWRYQSFHDKHRGFVFCIACGVFWKI